MVTVGCCCRAGFLVPTKEFLEERRQRFEKRWATEQVRVLSKLPGVMATWCVVVWMTLNNVDDPEH
jgi:hypothetical protein